MTPSFLAVLPAIMPDLSRRCIASMAPELRDRLLLVDNTETGEIAAEHRESVMTAVAIGHNSGVTWPWNCAIRSAWVNGWDWVYIVSQSVEFGAAGGLDLLELADVEPHILHSQYGWHAIAIHARVWKTVGDFDPLFPSYGNEVEYLYRLHLAGLPSPEYNDGRFSQVNINASCEPPAACLRAGVVKVDYAEHLDRYRAKWLGDKGSESTTHPYGIESLDWRHIGEPPHLLAVP